MRGLALIALLLGIVAGCGGSSQEATPPVETSVSEDVGQPAPTIEGVTLDGMRISLAELRGRPVFVNVWSSW